MPTAGLIYKSTCFTCKATGTKLTLRTATVGVDPETGEKDVYLKGKEPVIKPSQVRHSDRRTAIHLLCKLAVHKERMVPSVAFSNTLHSSICAY